MNDREEHVSGHHQAQEPTIDGDDNAAHGPDDRSHEAPTIRKEFSATVKNGAHAARGRVRTGAAGMSRRSKAVTRGPTVAAATPDSDVVVKTVVALLQTSCAEAIADSRADPAAVERAFGAAVEAFREAYARETAPAPEQRRRGVSVKIEEPDLPDGPPGGMSWARDRLPDEKPPDFIERVYGAWIERGMTKRQLRERDASLVIMLNTWLQVHPKPAFLIGKLPSKSDQYDRLVNAYEARHSGAAPAEIRRFSDAMRRRRKSGIAAHP